MDQVRNTAESILEIERKICNSRETYLILIYFDSLESSKVLLSP